MNNKALYESALEAIHKLYGDTSVSRSEALSNLKGLIDEIQILMEALESDEKGKE